MYACKYLQLTDNQQEEDEHGCTSHDNGGYDEAETPGWTGLAGCAVGPEGGDDSA